MRSEFILAPDYGKAVISGDCTLPELSAGIEILFTNFLGRGASRFELFRTKTDKGDCVLESKALCASESAPRFSKVTNLFFAVRDGIFPKDIPSYLLFQNEDREFRSVQDGQHRHGIISTSSANLTTSIIQTQDLDIQAPIFMLTYGLSDMFTGFFALGVRYGKYQGSVKISQVYVKHNLSHEKLQQYLLSKKDYDIHQKVNKLP